MSTNYANVNVFTVTDDKQLIRRPGNPFCVKLSDEQDNLLISFKNNSETSICDKDEDYSFYKDSEISRFGKDSVVVHNGLVTLLLSFNNPSESTMFNKILTDFKLGAKSSVFSQRTDEASASQYFQFYGYLSQQQNMMQDYIRTSTYQRAILGNTDDFRDAVVLDVGAGSGILSFFAAQAGARKVYAVEASSMAKHAEQLVFHNKLQNKIVVIPGKIEEITLPEKVDIIISEPMGYMLFNERMLETYLHAKKWLQPSGKMFPTLGDLHIAPFSDAALYMEQLNKANFWYQENFHGVDLTVLRTAAVKEYFRQPVVDTFDIRICMARSHRYTVDFQTAPETDLHLIDIPFSFVMQHTADVHGLAFWFDVAFIGQNQTVWLSTSPTQPLTHWYQVRCLVDTPIFCTAGQIMTGRVTLRSNKRQSYDVDIELNLEGTTRRALNSLDLKNPYFRYTGQTQQPPPGAHETSPTEQYWQSMDNNNQVMNGAMNGNSGVVLMDMSGIHSNAQSSGQLTNSANIQPIQQHPHVQQQQQHQQHQQQQQQGSLNIMGQQQPHQSSLVNLGSMPSPGNNGRSNPSRIPVSSAVPPSSIGGGITPSMFTPNPSVSVLNTTTFPFKDQESNNNNNFNYYVNQHQDQQQIDHQQTQQQHQLQHLNLHHQQQQPQQAQQLPSLQPLPQLQQPLQPLQPLQIQLHQNVNSVITYQDISSPSSSSSSSV